MAEKVLHELRIIETDDGYRIEIKGDKERLKDMVFGKGFGQFGPQQWGHGPFGRGGGHGPFGHHGPRGFGWGRRGGFGPWWSEEDETKEKNDQTREA